MNMSWIFTGCPPTIKRIYGNEGVVQWANEWKADAIIASWDHEGSNLLATLGIPVLLQNYRERSPYFSNLTGDYVGTGAMAARFFLKRRFHNLAFYGNKGVVGTRKAEGFRAEVEKAGANYFYFESESLNGDEWSSSHVQLEEWLVSLPKPVGLFACDDNFALQVSTLCKINNIPIPHDISLLGVDNDELICNLSDRYLPSFSMWRKEKWAGWSTR